jgi:hypothetical protein
MRILYMSIATILLSTLTFQITFAQTTRVTVTNVVKKSYNGADVSCKGQKNAELTVSASGGSGTFEYSNGGQNYQASNIFSGLGEGTYAIFARDAKIKNATSSQYTVNVAYSLNAVTISGVQITGEYNGGDVSCSYSTDGSFGISAYGGAGALEYSKDNGITYQSSSAMNNVGAGTYVIKVRDANGCIAGTTPSITLKAPTPVSIVISSQTGISCSSTTGSISFDGKGGVGNYSASIDGGAFKWIGTSGSFSGLSTGAHQLAVKDNSGCLSLLDVQVASSFKASLSGNSSICSGTTTSFVINIPAGNGKVFTAAYKDEAGKSYVVNNLNAGNNTITTAPLSGSKTFTLVSVTNETGCQASVSGSSNIIVTPSGTWLGITSDWNDSNNWSCGAVPSSQTNVTIPVTNNDPVLTMGSVAIHDIIIQQNASLTVKSIFKIGGVINNSGVFNAAEGTIEFNGSSAQSFSGSYFLNKTIKNLTLTNAVGLSLNAVPNDTLNITGTVSFANSNVVFNTNDNLTLKSSIAATANIADITSNGMYSGNNIVGNVTVEHYINTGKAAGQLSKKWFFVGFPTQGQSVKESLMENGNIKSTGYGVQVTGVGGTASGFDLASPSPSMKFYNISNGSWTGITKTADPVYDAKGYMIFVRGDRSVDGKTVTDPNPTNLRTKGKLILGDQVLTLPSNNPFTTIANPFASDIDMRNVTQSTGSDFFYVWNPLLGGTYGYGDYEFCLKRGDDFYTFPGGQKNNLIKSGEAFFVQTGRTASTLTIRESSKAAANGGQNARPMGVSERTAQIRSGLYGVAADGTTTLVDGTIQQFSSSFSNDINEMDGRKVFGSLENLSIKSGGKDLVIERKQMMNAEDTIFYGVTGLKAQSYQLTLTAENIPASGLQGFVEDTYLKTTSPLNLQGATDIRFVVTRTAASYAANRFRIVFKQAAALPVTFTSVKAAQKNEVIAVEWKVENERNMLRYDIERSVDGNSFSNNGSVAAINGAANSYSWTDKTPVTNYNFYRIKSVDLNGKVNYTQIVKVFMGKASGDITVYPNPIVNGNVNLQLTNQPAGVYNVRLLNPLGQVVLTKQITHTEGSSTETIKWDYNFARGVYQLEINRPVGEVKTIKIMY